MLMKQNVNNDVTQDLPIKQFPKLSNIEFFVFIGVL